MIRQVGRDNDHPSLPTFLQLYRLLSIYKLVKPPRFGNCTPDDLKDSRPPISMDDLKNIFSQRNPDPPALQKLKEALDSLVQYDDWEEEDILAECYDGMQTTELEDMLLYAASGYLCRKFLKSVKCEKCRKAFLTNLDTSNLAIAELVNARTRGFLLYCNLHLYQLFRMTEVFFQKNVLLSDCYEKTTTDVLQHVKLSFPCDEHKIDVIANSLYYYILMRMRQYERQQNRSLKKRSRTKKKEAKLQSE